MPIIRPPRRWGGDFYDFIPLEDDRIGVLIGDVSGKGIASALFMARLTSDFRVLALREKDPERLIARMNLRIFEQSRRGMFVTLLYMILSKGSNEVVYINAGHLPPVLWNHCEDKPAILHGRGGPPLGILAERQFSVERIPLKPCDCILLATDGLIEARNEQGERFGWERLVDALGGGKSDIGSVKDRIGRSIDAFVKDCPQADDTTLVLVGYEES